MQIESKRRQGGKKMRKEKKIIILCSFMEIVLLLGLIFAPIFDQIALGLQAGNDYFFVDGVTYDIRWEGARANFNYELLAGSVLLRDLIISFMLWQFYKIFKNIRLGTIFNQHQIKLVSRCGWCFITLSVYSIYNNLLYGLSQSPDNDMQYDFFLNDFKSIPIGIGLVLLGHVLKLATEMKEEQELVI